MVLSPFPSDDTHAGPEGGNEIPHAFTRSASTFHGLPELLSPTMFTCTKFFNSFGVKSISVPPFRFALSSFIPF